MKRTQRDGGLPLIGWQVGIAKGASKSEKRCNNAFKIDVKNIRKTRDGHSDV